MRRDSSFCAEAVRYNIFTNGAPAGLYQSDLHVDVWFWAPSTGPARPQETLSP